MTTGVDAAYHGKYKAIYNINLLLPPFYNNLYISIMRTSPFLLGPTVEDFMTFLEIPVIYHLCLVLRWIQFLLLMVKHVFLCE